MFIDRSELLNEIEKAIRFNYDTESLIDPAKLLDTSSAETAANAQAPKLGASAAQEGLPVVSVSDTVEYLHANTPPSEAAQYLNLESMQDPQQSPQVFDPQSQEAILAMEMLLANNGSLFNGAVGGLPFTPANSQNSTTERAERSAHRRAEHKRAKVRGVPSIEHNLDEDNDEHHSREQYEALFDPKEDPKSAPEQSMGAYMSFSSPGQSATRGFVS